MEEKYTINPAVSLITALGNIKIDDFDTSIFNNIDVELYLYFGEKDIRKIYPTLEFDINLAPDLYSLVLEYSKTSFGIAIRRYQSTIVVLYMNKIEDIDGLSNYYGLTYQYLLETNTAPLFTLMHELAHAYLTPNDEENDKLFNEYFDFLNIQIAQKKDVLTFLRPILNLKSEAIAHLTSNAEYLKFIVNNKEIRNRLENFIYYSNSKINELVPIFNQCSKILIGQSLFDENKRHANDFSQYLTSVFFEKNEKFILGEKSYSTFFGKEVIVAKKNGFDEKIRQAIKNYDEIIDEINSYDLTRYTKISNSVETKLEERETAKVVTVKRGNIELVPIYENIKRYSKDKFGLTDEEIAGYIFCHPEVNTEEWLPDYQKYNVNDLLNKKVETIINRGYSNETRIKLPIIVYDGEKYNYYAEFIDGILEDKIKLIEGNIDKIIEKCGEDYYTYLINILKGIRDVFDIDLDAEDYDKRYKIDYFSDVTENFIFPSDDDSDGENELSYLKDGSYIGNYTLRGVIYKGLSNYYMPKDYDGVEAHDISRVINGKDIINLGSPRDPDRPQKEFENNIRIQKALDALNKFTSDFIKNELNDAQKKELKKFIKTFVKDNIFADFTRIPLGINHNLKFKKNVLKIQEKQLHGLGFAINKKNSLLGYDVGFGKTIISLLYCSYLIDNNLVDRILVVTPKKVLNKWALEATGDEKKGLHGVVAHIPIIKFGNLSIDSVRPYKKYSDEELIKIKDLEKRAEKLKELQEKILSLFIDVTEEKVPFDYVIEEKSHADKLYRFTKLSEEYFEHFDFSAIQHIISEDIFYEVLNNTEELRISYKYVYPKFMIYMQSFMQIIYELKQKKLNTDYEILNILSTLHGLIDDVTDIMNKYPKYSYLLDKNEEYTLNDIRIIEDYIFYFINIINQLTNEFLRYKTKYEYTAGVFVLPEKCIIFLTYEGLKRITFSEEVARNSSRFLISKMYINLTEKDRQKYLQKLQSLYNNLMLNGLLPIESLNIGAIIVDEVHAYKGLVKTINTQGLIDAEKASISSLSRGSEPSDNALTLFAVRMYLETLKLNNIKDTYSLYLSATPITNSPLEIYSMLCLINPFYLDSAGITSVLQFAKEYFKITYSLQITADGAYDYKYEVTGFKNLLHLKRLLFNIIDYRTGEEAGLERPCKIVLPIKSNTTVCKENKFFSFKYDKEISTNIKENEEVAVLQSGLSELLIEKTSSKSLKYTIEKFMAYLRKNADKYNYDVEMANKINTFKKIFEQYYFTSKDSDLAIFAKLMNAFKLCSLSPYAFRPFLLYKYGYLFEERNVNIEGNPETVFETIESLGSNQFHRNFIIEKSPKIMYIINQIEMIYNYLEQNNVDKKGIIIYSNMGFGKNNVYYLVNVFEYLKEYLKEKFNLKNTHRYEHFNQETGRKRTYKIDEVEIISSEITQDKREAIQNLFNEGKVKIIIGSPSIREGVDLQENTIALFNLTIDWNPTDAKQIEGRAWRQGNRNGHVLIYYPLLENSFDSFMYQKLQEKTQRLVELWKKDNVINQYDIEEFDPEELKKKIMTQSYKRAMLKLIQDIEGIGKRIKYIKEETNELSEKITYLSFYNEKRDELKQAIRRITTLMNVMQLYDKIVNSSEGYYEFIEDFSSMFVEIIFANYRNRNERVSNIIENFIITDIVNLDYTELFEKLKDKIKKSVESKSEVLIEEKQVVLKNDIIAEQIIDESKEEKTKKSFGVKDLIIETINYIKDKFKYDEISFSIFNSIFKDNLENVGSDDLKELSEKFKEFKNSVKKMENISYKLEYFDKPEPFYDLKSTKAGNYIKRSTQIASGERNTYVIEKINWDYATEYDYFEAFEKLTIYSQFALNVTSSRTYIILNNHQTSNINIDIFEKIINENQLDFFIIDKNTRYNEDRILIKLSSSSENIKIYSLNLHYSLKKLFDDNISLKFFAKLEYCFVNELTLEDLQKEYYKLSETYDEIKRKFPNISENTTITDVSETLIDEYLTKALQENEEREADYVKSLEYFKTDILPKTIIKSPFIKDVESAEYVEVEEITDEDVDNTDILNDLFDMLISMSEEDEDKELLNDLKMLLISIK